MKTRWQSEEILSSLVIVLNTLSLVIPYQRVVMLSPYSLVLHVLAKSVNDRTSLLLQDVPTQQGLPMFPHAMLHILPEIAL